MKMRAITGGVYPGNSKALARRLKGEDVPDDECEWVEFSAGEILDGAKLDPRIVKSLRENRAVEEVSDG